MVQMKRKRVRAVSPPKKYTWGCGGIVEATTQREAHQKVRKALGISDKAKVPPGLFVAELRKT